MTATEDVAQMLALVPWLLERPGASVTETAETFGITEKALRRHLYHLDFCGLPGLGGGALFDVSIVGDRIVVQMADELRRPLRLAPREALTLVLVGEAAAQALEDELPALRSALDRVRAAAGVPAQVQVRLEEDGTEWVAPLRDAIAAGRRVELTYQGRGDDRPSTRVVDPWQLDVSEGYWYVQGRDHDADDRRTFRLDRVGDVEVLDEAREQDPPAEGLPPPAYEPAAGDHEVELTLGPAARWLADAVEPDEVEDRADGTRRLRFHTDALPWIARLCLVAGAEATVVRPTELAAQVTERARGALERYDHPTLGP